MQIQYKSRARRIVSRERCAVSSFARTNLSVGCSIDTPGSPINRQLESITVFRRCGDRVAAEDSSQASDGVGEVCLAYVDGGPECLDQLLFADQMFCPLDQAEQSVKGFGLERSGNATFLFQEPNTRG